MKKDLFTASLDRSQLPLSERVRPQTLQDLIGQEHVLSSKSALVRLLNNQQLLNFIFWGPPGTGKTTLALAISQMTQAHFESLNAVSAGVKELKEICLQGRERKFQYHQKTLLFVDEIHRFNKSQQDVLLPHVEQGDVYLIGATTEYPSYEINKALLSRCQIVEFKRLTNDNLKQILFKSTQELGVLVEDLFQSETVESLCELADGDARRLLNMLELVFKVYQVKTEDDGFPLSLEKLSQLTGRKMMAYDKKSDHHYDTISAFIKSMRGSDVDAALYYCARMLEGGEDPTFIVRRMIIFASEDIGNADPRALTLAVSCLQAVEAVGMPEGRIMIGQTVCYLASCPKSNKSYLGINAAIEFVKKTGSPEIPLQLRSAQKGEGYLYPHSYGKGWVKQNYWPTQIKETFFEPSSRGFEKTMSEYLKWMKEEP